MWLQAQNDDGVVSKNNTYRSDVDVVCGAKAGTSQFHFEEANVLYIAQHWVFLDTAVMAFTHLV